MQENELNDLAAFHVNKACEHLRQCEISIKDYLMDFVASICDVDKNKVWEATDVVYLAHARWFFWYACRYMTSESYDKIACQSFQWGHPYTARAVQNGVNKMSAMIDKEPLWKKRWLLIKQIIKVYNSEEKEIKTITINIPKELKDIIKVEITKEK